MNIVIHGYYGAGNIGDDAILDSIVDSLLYKFPEANISVITRGVTTAYYEKHNVNEISIKQIEKVQRTIKLADTVIIGGGGILQDYSGWEPQSTFGIKAKGMNYYGQIVELAYSMGKPIYFYGIGIGPFKSPKSAEYAISLLSKANRITVRDEDSYQFVKKHLPKANVKYSADPALNMKSAPTKSIQAVLKLEKIPTNKKLVGICLRPWFYVGEEKEKLLNHIAIMCKMLANDQDVHFVLMPFCQYKGDKYIMKQLSTLLPPQSFTLIKNDYSPRIFKSLISNFDLIVGMRLHSLILSASTSVPFIGLSYDPKMDHFGSGFQHFGEILDYRQVKTNTLYQLARKYLKLTIDEKHQYKRMVLQIKWKEKANRNYLFPSQVNKK
ncbi:polysaccharide pyruvyl transferase family protein [Pontibacillus yanchengensis]|uniref:Polysaccharide pyruvyl transferase domain-containing protein n=1 Tax=Pontibacillus yanchengensis Y32 TaxID=1385514 RepID=A0A0A2TC32_9BACI|nr:polysaccharide pyruvyl transferase family protein [Pontibacillus yanchengensis]KGP71651.1 hypothetical protein N782_17765 [Pontibacillus yanchengensis Y32]